METIPMLGNVDDEKHYAQLLETSYVEAYCELRQIITDGQLRTELRSGGQPHSTEVHVNCEELIRLRDQMNHTVQQTVDRRRRLADITAGLADVVLDEEGTKE